MLTERFDAALSFARRLHGDQRRKGSETPYLAHLLGVASLVLEHGGDEEMAIGALLHDVIEDQGASYPGGVAALRMAIDRHFGPAVLAIVDGCTDTVTNPKPPWRGRKAAYVARLAQAPAGVLLVAAADKLHNARAILADYRVIRDRLWDRFTGGKAGTLWYYRALVTALEQAAEAPERLAAELDRVVTQLEAAVEAISEEAEEQHHA